MGYLANNNSNGVFGPQIRLAFDSVREGSPDFDENWKVRITSKLYIDGINFSEAWNFGPNEDCSISVLDLVKKLDALWDKSINWNIDKGNHPKESNYLRLDISKSKNKLSWKPLLDIDTTLHFIIDWSNAFVANEDMKKFTISQIESYESSLDL